LIGSFVSARRYGLRSVARENGNTLTVNAPAEALLASSHDRVLFLIFPEPLAHGPSTQVAQQRVRVIDPPCPCVSKLRSLMARNGSRVKSTATAVFACRRCCCCCYIIAMRFIAARWRSADDPRDSSREKPLAYPPSIGISGLPVIALRIQIASSAAIGR